MNRVLVVPKHFFIDLLRHEGIDDSNVEQRTGIAFISIQNSKGIELWAEPYFKADHENAISLVFDDLTDKDTEVLENYPGSRLISKEDAEKIVEFVERNKDRRFLVHCTAGVSRSGAVGEYIRRVINLDWGKFIRANPHVKPNNYVLMMLMRAKREWDEKGGTSNG